jgi:hypothetical protein
MNTLQRHNHADGSVITHNELEQALDSDKRQPFF